ncbi:receptor-type tyrosine-protein kinase FLT3-like [Protopterus annectens]|uniref:receptor-type tyrosine-protein kinase FLT3-like n=1 Tax=Protopterus annectens TaxID=7888 RepID=UPI001CFA9E50|nr:receptor-type tyrosine-protein kinase FLT3-like [Protopterus annectens]
MTSKMDEFLNEVEFIKNLFLERGYPEELIENIVKEVIENRNKKCFPVIAIGIPQVDLTSTDDEFICSADSYPQPEVTWQKVLGNHTDEKSGETLTKESLTKKTNGGKFGHITVTSTLRKGILQGTGYIKCCANNAAGSVCKNMPIADKDTTATPWFVIGAVSGGLLLLVAVLIYSKCKQKPRYESQMKMVQFINSADNEYIYIDCSLLDYNPKWEFPRENLEFGKTLGSGAFGKVMEATAYGICKPGVSVQVAVKMLKDKHEPSEKDALMSELKMMTHLGHHKNIVNLLGACTVSGPVYLIFEYCCYGDLLNYLRSKREKFHRNWTDVLIQNSFSLYHNCNTDHNCRDRILGCDMPFRPRSRTQDSGICSFSQDPDKQSENSESITTSDDDQQKMLNLERYEEDDLNVLTFEDLLIISYQVAKGMEFLTSRNCIHRDLAARNVLLTTGKVAKICDFGLARDIMNDSNYVIKGNARLPVKWMAPESIFRGIYTNKSDVWSYGILLWEIFSLGVNPYPGIVVDEKFYRLIQNGFRMEQPFYATENIYGMMQTCWNLNADKRPSFSQLVSMIETHLSDAEAELYQNVKCGMWLYNPSYGNKPGITMDLPTPSSTTSQSESC